MRPMEEITLSREYIARDPRTGLPIAVAKQRKSVKKMKVESGPWVTLSDEEVFSLLKGETETVSVRWKDQTISLGRINAIRALGRFHGIRVHQAHSLLIACLESDVVEDRIAALEVLPEVAVLKSDELFDWLSVLLDDQDINVRKAASRCLTITSPVFPSGVSSILANELRSSVKHRMDAAWAGLSGLCETWPEVVVDHVDSLLLEEDMQLRKKATALLKKIVNKGGSPVWDLISWSLNDAEVEVRRVAAKNLPALARKESRMATLFAERALSDSDSEVRLSAIKAVQVLDTDNGRARDLVVRGTTSKDLKVRSACVELLPRLFGEEILRTMAEELLNTETDEKIIASLKEMTFDASLDGTEAQKNAQLAPSAPVPALDREVAEAHGHRVGLEPIRPTDTPLASNESGTTSDKNPKNAQNTPATEPATAPVYRAVSQDEVMGYEDDFEDDEADDDADYF
jgi:HEAT repeat protein